MLRPCILLVALAACSSGTLDNEEPPDPPPGIALQQVVGGLQRPVHLTAPEGDSRLFIVEQPGRIRIVKNGQLLAEPFLDIVSRVGSQENEQGLLSVAFHPDYATNGYFYVDYTNREGDTRIERYSVSGDPDRADATSASLVLGFDQPYGNHNGGHLLFGPDGMLYIASGDGGSGGDPQGNGQNRNSFLGKILRIDVDGGDPYAIPPDNPFVDQAGVRPEIWAYGLRNPWRIAFDEVADLLFIADVGQNAYEEISVVPSDQGGLNFGWNPMEGSHCFQPSSGCDRSGLTLPVLDYPRADGISITGGFVYRGTAIPTLQGRYVYADYGRQWVRSFRYEGGQAQDNGPLDVAPVSAVSSFGVDGAGELYVVSLAGSVFKFVPES